MSTQEWGSGTVYKRDNSSFWWIKYSVGGKVRRESSGSHVRHEAVKLLRRRMGQRLQVRDAAKAERKSRCAT
jgi:hypothetical protein